MNPTRLPTLALLTATLVATDLTFAATTGTTWSGGGGANQNWSASANWSAGVPGTTSDVKFYNGGSAATASNINNIVDASFPGTIASLQYGNSNGFHTTLIAAGKTLTITNGLSAGTGTSNGNSFQLVATITGPGGAIILTNGNLTAGQGNGANGSHWATLDLSGLDTLSGTLGRVLVGAGSTSLRYCAGNLNLARTNLLTLTGASPQMLIGDNSGNATGPSSIVLGQTNAFFADAVTVGGQKQPASMSFTNAFSAPVLYLHGTNATTGRVTTLAIADNSGQSTSGNTTTGTLDLSAGTCDVMAGTVYLGRGQTSSGTGGATGTLTIGAGTFNVNTMELGYQNSSGAAGTVAGTVNVNTNGFLLVNTSLRLGRNAGSSAAAQGTLNVNGGTVMVATNIVDGGGSTTAVNVNSGTLDLNPAGAPTPNNLTCKTLTLGSVGPAVITNAGIITVSNSLTISADGVIAGTNATIDLPSGATMDVTAFGSGFTLGTGQTLQDAGSVSGSFIEGTGASLSPGGRGVAGTLTFNSDLTLSAGGNLLFDLSNDPSQIGNANDLLQVSGNLYLSGTNSVLLSALNSDFANGAYRLINCGSIASGDATYFQVVGPVAQSRRLFQFDTSAAGEVNLNVSGTPAASLLWVGDGVNNNWDLIGTADWNNAGSADEFYNLDSVTFDDTGSASPAVNLSGTLVPGSLTVSNNAEDYTFSGSGVIAGNTGLNKQGTRTLTLAGTGVHAFAGPITIGGGTLAYNRADNVTVANTIGGTGTLAKLGAGILTLAPATSVGFDSPIVVSGGTLKAGNTNALGSTAAGTTISGGGTLDLNGLNLTPEAITVSGLGVGGNGAIINSGGSDFPALTHVTLAGDTAIGGPGAQAQGGSVQGRWDIRLTGSGATDPALSTLSTSGQPYNLYKVGSNYVGICNVTVDPSLANIDIQGGTLSFQYNTTSLGDPSKTVTVEAGADLDFYNITNLVSKPIVLNGDGVSTNLSNSSGTNTLLSPITLNGGNVVNVAGTSLTLDGPISGGGKLTKTGGSPLVLAGANSYSGGTVIAAGTLQIGTNTTSGTLPASPTGILTNNGTLVFNRSDSFSYGDQIVGSGGVQQIGSGIVTLTAANTYSNQTVINSTNYGALRITNPNALGDPSGNTAIVGNTNGLGRLELAGNITVAEPLLVDCRQDISANVPAVLNVSDNNTLSGTISGNTGGGLWNFRSDSGKLTISGNFSNTTTSATRIIQLMGTGTGEWSGAIFNNSSNTSLTGVTKTNSGTWTLSGANQYTGPTTVSTGTLIVSGSIASGGSVAVNNGILTGTGTINSPVTVNPAGTLEPGGAPVGTLTILSSVVLNGTTAMRLNKSGSTLSSDLIQGVSSLTYGGTLQLTMSGDPLAKGDSFTLFAAGLHSGAFTTLVPPAPGPQLAWDTTHLATDGSLRVIASVNSSPTNITAVVLGGTNLSLSWPSDHTGWYL
ncbi:MAG TPA: autotransporter-associated beta strand repeat-containing protein, partial [Candidatus Acidoferrum sp.]|nr:autotransporter-associated beta strand repeat-containing protein [Candidatus Acidoferrum sp.]